MDSSENMQGRAGGVVGVLLAGGRGERFRASLAGDGIDKLLCQLPDGGVLAAVSARRLLAVVPQVVAVVRPGAPGLTAALSQEGCVVLEAADTARGMGATLAHAARYLVRADAKAQHPARTCIVALADMPWIREATLRAVLQAARSHRIAAPTYRGRRGHPVAFAREFWEELAGLDGDEGARALLLRHGVLEVACQDPGVLRDIDTVDDLRAPR